MWRVVVMFYDQNDNDAELEAEIVNRDLTDSGYDPMSVKVYKA